MMVVVPPPKWSMSDLVSIQVGGSSNLLHACYLEKLRERFKGSQEKGKADLWKVYGRRAICVDYKRNFPSAYFDTLYEIQGDKEARLDISEGALKHPSSRPEADTWHADLAAPLPYRDSITVPDSCYDRYAPDVSYALGAQQYCQSLVFCEKIEESVRRSIEECDCPTGFNVLLDTHSSLAFAGQSILYHLDDEYRRKPKMVLATWDFCHPNPETWLHQVFLDSLIMAECLTLTNTLLLPMSGFQKVAFTGQEGLVRLRMLDRSKVDTAKSRFCLFAHVLESISHPWVSSLRLSMCNLVEAIRCSTWGSGGGMAGCSLIEFSQIGPGAHIFSELTQDGGLPNLSGYCCLSPNHSPDQLHRDYVSYHLVSLNDHPRVENDVILKSISEFPWRDHVMYGLGSNCLSREQLLKAYLSYSYPYSINESVINPCLTPTTDIGGFGREKYCPTITSLFTGRCLFAPVLQSLRNMEFAWKRVRGRYTDNVSNISSDLVESHLSFLLGRCEVLDPLATTDLP